MFRCNNHSYESFTRFNLRFNLSYVINKRSLNVKIFVFIFNFNELKYKISLCINMKIIKKKSYIR